MPRNALKLLDARSTIDLNAVAAKVSATATLPGDAKLVEIPMFHLTGHNPTMEEGFGRAPLWVEESDFDGLAADYARRSSKAPLDIMHSSFEPIVDPTTGQPVGKIGTIQRLFKRDSIGWAECLVEGKYAAKIAEFTFSSPCYGCVIDARGYERPRLMHSLAITNTPSIDGLPEIKAASAFFEHRRRFLGAAATSSRDWLDVECGSSMYVEAGDPDDIRMAVIKLLNMPVASTREEIFAQLERLWNEDTSARAQRRTPKEDSPMATNDTTPKTPAPSGPVTREEFNALATNMGEVLTAVRSLQTGAQASHEAAEGEELERLVESARAAGKLSVAQKPSTLEVLRDVKKARGLDAVKKHLDGLPIAFPPDAVDPKAAAAVAGASARAIGTQPVTAAPKPGVAGKVLSFVSDKLGVGGRALKGTDVSRHEAVLGYQEEQKVSGRAITYEQALLEYSGAEKEEVVARGATSPRVHIDA